MSAFLFLDIETTGLDPKRDGILEIYCQPCSPYELNTLAPPFHRYVQATQKQLDGMGSFVLNMHLDTGLLGEKGEPLDEVIRDLSKYLANYPKGRLVGRNVGTFDRRFLEEAGVDLSGLHFRCIDISTLLQTLSLWPSERPFVEPKFRGTKHRAEDDVLADIELLGAIADYLESVE